MVCSDRGALRSDGLGAWCVAHRQPLSQCGKWRDRLSALALAVGGLAMGVGIASLAVGMGIGSGWPLVVLAVLCIGLGLAS